MHLRSHHVRSSRDRRGHPTAAAWDFGRDPRPPAGRVARRRGGARAPPPDPWRVRRSGGAAPTVPRGDGHAASTPPAPPHPTRDRCQPTCAMPPTMPPASTGCPPENGCRHPAAAAAPVVEGGGRHVASAGIPPPRVRGGVAPSRRAARSAARHGCKRARRGVVPRACPRRRPPLPPLPPPPPPPPRREPTVQETDPGVGSSPCVSCKVALGSLVGRGGRRLGGKLP